MRMATLGRSRHERGYGTAWDKLRNVALQRDKWLCVACMAKDRITPAKEVDHIIRKAGGGTDDLDNLQSLCTPCHADKTRMESGGAAVISVDGWPIEPPDKRWGYSIPDGVRPSGIPVVLISGPPAAGKSTYVETNAQPEDMRIDFDIYRQRVGGVKWDTRWSVRRKAFAMRQADIRSLEHRTQGKCYLIVTAPTKRERDRWCEALGNVTVVVVDTPAAVCVKRINADPKRRDASVMMIRAVKNWWDVD